MVLGHPDTDDPAMGWVAGLRRVGDRLQAHLKDLAPAFRTAIMEGRYGPRSICATLGATERPAAPSPNSFPAGSGNHHRDGSKADNAPTFKMDTQLGLISSGDPGIPP